MTTKEDDERPEAEAKERLQLGELRPDDRGQDEVRGLGRRDDRRSTGVRVGPVTSARLATAISQEDHAQGPADAAITLVQYGDYECPYTRLSRHSVHQLQHEFADLRAVRLPAFPAGGG